AGGIEGAVRCEGDRHRSGNVRPGIQYEFLHGLRVATNADDAATRHCQIKPPVTAKGDVRRRRDCGIPGEYAEKPAGSTVVLQHSMIGGADDVDVSVRTQCGCARSAQVSGTGGNEDTHLVTCGVDGKDLIGS